MTNEDNTAIIRYVGAAEGEQYWRINRMGIVLSRRAMDKRVKELRNEWQDIYVDGVLHDVVACQWPSRNTIYRRWEL